MNIHGFQILSARLYSYQQVRISAITINPITPTSDEEWTRCSFRLPSILVSGLMCIDARLSLPLKWYKSFADPICFLFCLIRVSAPDFADAIRILCSANPICYAPQFIFYRIRPLPKGNSSAIGDRSSRVISVCIRQYKTGPDLPLGYFLIWLRLRRSELPTSQEILYQTRYPFRLLSNMTSAPDIGALHFAVPKCSTPPISRSPIRSRPSIRISDRMAHSSSHYSHVS